MPNTRFPSYRKPPVTEVACGVTFAALQNFSIPHYGLFWERIRSKFPNTQHSAPLMVRPGELVIDSSSGGPLPRVWFISEKKNDLIQIQADCFFYNWRKVDEDQSYPRYPNVIAAFKEFFLEFSGFLESEKIGKIDPTICELTYVNHIPKGEAWSSVQDIGRVFKDYSWNLSPGRFLPVPTTRAWNATFQLPNSAGQLTARLSQVLRISDKAPTLRLDMTAKGIGQGKAIEDLWRWFDLAHEWIVCGFADLTQDEIQHRIWEREDA